MFIDTVVSCVSWYELYGMIEVEEYCFDKFNDICGFLLL